jgi:threonine synthase
VSDWTLECSECGQFDDGSAPPTVCRGCGMPLLVRFPEGRFSAAEPGFRWDMWRYSPLLPITAGEIPVSLGEGLTPLLEAPSIARELGIERAWIKDEGLNPTGSFKARGMSAAVTRLRDWHVPGLVAPTAGNAGAALAAYGSAAGLPVQVFAPRTTPPPILATIVALGASLKLVEGHIGDAGREARAFAAESGFFDVSTLREPYRVEGKKTMGIEVAEQLGWRLPTHIVYPTGGGTGLIGMWKVFSEMIRAGWLPQGTRLPRMIVAQADGCAPIVSAFRSGSASADPWPDPATIASGLRVPSPLGGRLILRALAESGGHAESVADDGIILAAGDMAAATGIDVSPEGGAALAVARVMARKGLLARNSEVVIFNTGSGASYRS